MPKRIYVGLSKMSAGELRTISRESGIDRAKLEKAARGQLQLDPSEVKKISAAVNLVTDRERPREPRPQ